MTKQLALEILFDNNETFACKDRALTFLLLLEKLKTFGYVSQSYAEDAFYSHDANSGKESNFWYNKCVELEKEIKELYKNYEMVNG